jgi:putative ABC transport system substrate-binding protein
MELVEARVDVIVAINTPGARAAIQATKQIPIIMSIVGDPVSTGFVTSMARPTGNVTGVSNMSADLASKRMSLLKDLLPVCCSIRSIPSQSRRSGTQSAAHPFSAST